MARPLRIRFARRLALAFLTIFVATFHCIEAYITSHHAVPPQRQMKWLKELTSELTMAKPGELSRDQLSTAPDLMYALSHARESSKENALILESLVKRLIDEQRAGNDAAKDLTVEDYNCLLEGWARSGESVAAAERCEQILQAMQQHGVEPDLGCFKAVLMAWRQSTDCDYAPVRAQRILEWMIQLHSDGANDGSFPDAECFDMVLQTWGRSRHPDAPQRAEAVLVSMERLYESTKLESIRPRATSFNAVLAAWARSDEPRAAERAADILAFMELLPDVEPDSASYCTVVTALARSQVNAEVAATKATVFLRHAIQLATKSSSSSSTDTTRLVLDTILFNTAMGLWSKTNASGAYRKAWGILQRQRQLHSELGHSSCRPDVFGFTSVLASCASVRDNREFADAWQMAATTYEQLRNEDKANHVSYATMLKACVRLLGHNAKARHAWARKVFGHAVDSGCVNSLVLKRLEEAVSGKVFRVLLQGYSPNNLPASWTAHIQEQPRTKGHRQRRPRSQVVAPTKQSRPAP